MMRWSEMRFESDVVFTFAKTDEDFLRIGTYWEFQEALDIVKKLGFKEEKRCVNEHKDLHLYYVSRKARAHFVIYHPSEKILKHFVPFEKC